MSARERLALRRNLTTLGSVPLRGSSFYRNIKASLGLNLALNTLYSEMRGGRYNRSAKYENSFGALYLADTPADALEEVEAMIGGTPQRFSPRIDLTIETDLSEVIDLRDPAAHAMLGVTLAELQDRSWPIKQIIGRTATQEIGAAAFALGIEGLLVPSARVSGAHNLVVLVDNMLAPSRIGIYLGPTEKPKPGQVLLGR